MSANTYNLKDLSEDIAKKFGLSHVQAARLTRFLVLQLRAQLAAGRQVRIHQFGTLVAKNRAAGIARNPTTGERIQVPARRVVRFTVSPSLRQHINAKG